MDFFQRDTTISDVIEVTDYKSAVRKQVVEAIDRSEVVLLAQKPGFGKTRLMLELCTRERFTMVFTPTKPLQNQVIAIARCEHAQSFVFVRSNNVVSCRSLRI